MNFDISTIARFVKSSLISSVRAVLRLLLDMDVFEFLPDFRVVVCKLCQSAVYPSAISTHLRRSHARYNSSSVSKKHIRTFINETPPKLLEMSLLDPRSEPVIVPTIDQTPLPHLHVYNGFGCS